MNKSLSGLRSRIPYRQDIVYVFGGVIFIIYSWSVRGFLYQLPALILYHSLLDIVSILFYLMAFALLESLLVMGGLILMGFALPRTWFVEGFVYKGFLTTLVTGISMIVLQNYLYSLNYETPPADMIYWGLLITVIILVVLILLFHKMPNLQRFVIFIEEQLQIFVYLYIPLGIAGLLIVIFRNL